MLCWTFIPCAFGEAGSTLTSAEWFLLQSRAKLKNNAVISDNNPEQRHLLKSPSREISPNADHLTELITQMRQAMLAHDGKGLTAVQIGIPVRVVIMERMNSKNKIVQTFINPILVSKSDQITQYWERCLSLPDVRNHLTPRHAEVTIRYSNLDGSSKTEKFNGDEAAVFQQELDHLDGILLTDHHY